jgi:hypothetical protein
VATGHVVCRVVCFDAVVRVCRRHCQHDGMETYHLELASGQMNGEASSRQGYQTVRDVEAAADGQQILIHEVSSGREGRIDQNGDTFG